MLALVVHFRSDRLIGYTMLQEIVNYASQFVSSRHDSLLATQPCPHPTVKSAQGALTTIERLGGHAQGLGRSMVNPQCPALDNFATRNVIVQCQAQPRTEMLDGGPFAH